MVIHLDTDQPILKQVTNPCYWIKLLMIQHRLFQQPVIYCRPSAATLKPVICFSVVTEQAMGSHVGSKYIQGDTITNRLKD